MIVIGLSASAGSDGVDVVKASKPVRDVDAAISEALDAVLKLVEPGIENVEPKDVRLSSKSKEGYALIYIPESDGSPRRSRVDSKFYVRIASGSIPMEYFQIEDRFGRRPHAKLIAEVEGTSVQHAVFVPNTVERRITFAISNAGRGLARFPCVRFLLEANCTIPRATAYPQPLWPIADVGAGRWLLLRGDANAVVYPNETLRLMTVVQSGEQIGSGWTFRRTTIKTESMCDGMTSHQQSFEIEGVVF